MYVSTERACFTTYIVGEYRDLSVLPHSACFPLSEPILGLSDAPLGLVLLEYLLVDRMLAILSELYPSGC